MKTIKLIITDSDIQLRKIIKQYLTKELQYDVIAEASDGEGFMNLPNIHLADIIIMDFMMQNINDYKLAKTLFITNPKIKVIAVVLEINREYLTKLIQIGFKACVLKNSFFDEINTAIQKVINNKLHFPKIINN